MPQVIRDPSRLPDGQNKNMAFPTNLGMNPGLMPGTMRPGMMNPGMNPGMMNPGMNPGMMRPGMNPGMNPGMMPTRFR
jgi:hypothetical protein